MYYKKQKKGKLKMYGKVKESVRILEKIKSLLNENSIIDEGFVSLVDIIDTLYIYNDINFKYLIDSTELFKLRKFSNNNPFISLEIKHPILNNFLSFDIDLKNLVYSVQSNSDYLLNEIYKLMNLIKDNNLYARLYGTTTRGRIVEEIFLYKLAKNIYFREDELTFELKQKLEETKKIKEEKNKVYGLKIGFGEKLENMLK